MTSGRILRVRHWSVGRGFTREETEDGIIDLNYLGIHNILEIREDETNYKIPVQTGRSANVCASDLVKQVNDLRTGIYLDKIINEDPIDFYIGVRLTGKAFRSP